MDPAECDRSTRWHNDFLGRTFRPAKRPRPSSQLKSLIWLRRSLSRSFRASRLQQGAGGWDHLRAGIARLSDEVIEPQSGQQRQEQEDAGDAGARRRPGVRTSWWQSAVAWGSGFAER